MNADPKTIVAGLTRGERAALMGEKVRGSAKPNLCKRGLMELLPRKQTWAAKQQRFDYRLTPLGLEVRKLLTSDQVTDTLDKPL